MALVNPDITNGEFDLQLTSGSTVIPLVMCDNSGNRNPLAFTRNPVRRSSLKMYSDQQRYADLEPPWTPVAQTDWSGGRGSKDFDKDASMYYDGYQVNTTRVGEIILGPKPISISLGEMVEMSNTLYTPISPMAYAAYFLDALSNASLYIKYSYAATKDISVKDITVILNRVSAAPTSGKLYLGLAVGGGGVTYSENYVDLTKVPQAVANYYRFVFTSPINVSNGQSFDLIFKSVNLTTTERIDVRAYRSNDEPAAGGYSWGTDGVNYTPAGWGYKFYWLMTNSGVKRNKPHFFEYKGALYYVLQNNDGSSSRLYLNGDHGLAKTGATTNTITIKGKATWTLNEAAGCIAVIVQGAGSNQPQNWRVIIGNTATSSGETALTFSDEWDIAPAENDVIAIVASEKFTEIKGTDGKTFDDAYNAVVTDVLSVNGLVYFACGDAATLIRMYAYNNAGVWTYNWSDHTASSYTDGSVEEDTTHAKFTYLAYMSDQTGTYIVGARGGYPSYIKRAKAIDGTGWTGSGESILAWGDAVNVGNLYERITGLEVYGEFGNLHIMKEGSVYELYDGRPVEIAIREMRNTLDYRNGKAHCVKGVYLYFSWHDTLLRYYNGMLDTIGPDRAEVAIPTENRRGYFSALAPYAGQLLASVDAGIDGVSSVLAYNDRGWCELYRGTMGERIQNLYIQSIPGNAVDRLWVAEGNKLSWLPLSVDPYNHPKDAYNPYQFVQSGNIISSWFYLGLQDIDKLYNALKLVSENCDSTYTMTAQYQTDDDQNWYDIPGTYDAFSKSLGLASSPSVTGKRLRYQLTLNGDGAGTPRVLAAVLDTITRLPNKYRTTVTCRLDLGAEDDYATALAKFNAISGLQDLATPVTVQSVVDMLDGTTAFVDGLTPRIMKMSGKNNRPSYLCQFELIEV